MTVQKDVIPVPRLKRLCDVVISIALGVLLAPIWIVVLLVMVCSMAVRRQDHGALLYRERRVSGGQEFDLLKFRVLRRDVLAGMGRNDHARLLESDPANLTWAGKHLLKPWYLDELPQLINILRGDMSLVGPRPWPIPLVQSQLAQGYDYRNHIRAGWTGAAQIRKGKLDPGGPPAHDLAYVNACRHWTGLRLVRYDLGILAETVKVLLRGQGLQY